MWILFMTVSGGGWIAVTVGLAIVLICWQLWTLGVIIPIVSFITLAIIIFFNRTPWLITAFSWNSFRYRITEWLNTIHIIKGYSIFTGLGPGNWVSIYNSHYDKADIIIHNSYYQLYNDTGILGIVALIIAVVVFVRLSLKMISSTRQNPWYGAGIGFIGSFVAGAVFACYDVTITGTIPTATSYIYLSVPLLWIIASMFVVSYKHLN